MADSEIDAATREKGLRELLERAWGSAEPVKPIPPRKTIPPPMDPSDFIPKRAWRDAQYAIKHPRLGHGELAERVVRLLEKQAETANGIREDTLNELARVEEELAAELRIANQPFDNEIAIEQLRHRSVLDAIGEARERALHPIRLASVERYNAVCDSLGPKLMALKEPLLAETKEFLDTYAKEHGGKKP